MRARNSSVQGGRKGYGSSKPFTRHPLTALMIASGLMPGWSYANNIVDDGRTATDIAVSGSVTDITTGTVRGKAGFNSFHHFELDQGNTVNLHVPGAASHLVNLVHDSRTVINGTLNGLKGGKIGGHIIFADPHGVVVGSSGVVNVGSLTVSTPSAAAMDEMLHHATSGLSSASAADEYVDKLVTGDVPMADLAADGSNAIVIQGMINTNGSINLHGASVLVGATAHLEAGTDAARAVFNSTVNTDGVAIGDGVSRQNGAIVITASNGVEISGELAALMSDDSGANVQIAGRKSVVLKGDAQIATSGKAGKNSGDVTIEAPSIKLQDNARVVTRATGAGESGAINVHALSDISCTFCDEAATPETLDQLKSGLATQANPWLSANLGTAEVVIGENASLDAGHTDATKAGDVSIQAYAVNRQMAGYAKATASIDIDGSVSGRDIAIAADARSGVSRDMLGMILNSYGMKQDIARLAQLNNWTEEETWANILDTLYEPIKAYAGTTDTNAFLSTPTNFTELTMLVPNLSAYIAQADATVDIGATADIDAGNDLDIWALSNRNVDSSTWSIPVLGSKIPFGFDAAYGQISGLTQVKVASGATLNAGRDMALAAHSDNTLNVTAAAENSVDGNGNALKTMGLGFGMAMSDIETSVIVADGANVTAGRDVDVAALTEQSIENDVSFKASGEGATGGPAIGISILKSKTRAEFNADLVGARDLKLTAANVVSRQISSVTVSAGAAVPGYLDKLKARAKEQVAKPVTDYVGTAVKNFFGIAPSAETTPEATDSKFRLASALGITLADHEVEAVLGKGGSAPNIDVTGDVAVQAWQDQKNLHNSAQSKVNASAKRDDGTTDGAAVSLSVAAVYTELDSKTHALVGDGTTVTAGRIGVGAEYRQPIGLLGLDRWASLKNVYANLKLLAGGPNAVVGKIATQYANSTGEADKLGMAGSLSVLRNTIDTTAWIGDNATLTATSADDAAWSNNVFEDLFPAIDSTAVLEARRNALRAVSMDWNAPLAVHAENQLEQLAIAGNFDALFGLQGNDGGAVGAGLNLQLMNNRAVAGIGANGTITAEAVDVSALQDDLIIGVSPSAGKGASVAGNGSVVVSVMDGSAHASIHNSTDVTADRVNVEAEHQLGLWSASGAIAASENVGVGVGVAVNVVNTDVYALIGDNNARTSDVNNWRPESMGDGLDAASRGAWLVNDLDLSAHSSGQSGAFAIAGALSRSEQEQQQQDQVAQQSGGADKGAQDKAGSLGEAIKMSLTNGLALITGEVSSAKTKAAGAGDAAMDKLSEYWTKVQNLFSGSSSGNQDGSNNPAEGFSLAAAASASVNVSAQKNRAHLGDIVLDPRDAGQGSEVDVLSLNQTHQFSGSGAGALTLSGGDKSKHSSALAGAMAYNHLKNITEAQVARVTFRANDRLDVTAASSGDQIALGLGLAAATQGETNVAVALSGSAGVFENQTRASVIDAVINQRAAAPGSIGVNAYDRSRSLLGGGSFAFSKDKGGSGGGSFVVGVMGNQLEAEWLGSTASDFATLDVKANSASRVLAGALGVAVSTGQESGAGAGSVFVVVMNNQVKATVDETDNRDSSLTGGAVTVAAASVPGMDALDGVFSHDTAAGTTTAEAGLDLDGTSTTADIDVKAETNDGLFKEDGVDTNAGEGSATAETTTHNLFDNGSIAGEAILGIAGALGATGGKAGVGGAFGVVYTGSEYAASVANTDINLTGDLNIAARNETDVLAAAIGAAGAQNVSVAGSAAALVGRGTVSANLDMTGRTLKADDLVVQALKTGGFYSLAGSISGSTNTAAVGAAISINDMEQSATAAITNGTYALTGDATLSAAQQSRIITAALSGAVSASGTGVGAAFTYNRIADTTHALLQSAALTANDMTISASQPNLGASIWSLAFNLAAGGGTAGVGAGVAVNLIDAERSAKLAGSTVNLSGDASMTSALDGEIWSIGIDAAGGGTAGVGGSFAANNINGSDAVVIENSTLIATGTGQALDLDASAGNGLTIASLAGSVTGGGTAAVGLAASVNRIAADRTALISGSSITDFSDVNLKSGVEQAIYSIAVAGGGAGTVAVNGATTTNILAGTERAAIENSVLTVGSLDVTAAQGKRTIWGLGAVVNGAGTVAVGAANVNNIILAKRVAEIQASTLNMTGALNVASGGDALIRSAALGGGGAGTAAVGASVAVNVVEGEETARLDGVTVSGATGLTVEVTHGEADIKTLAGNVQGGGSGAGAGAVAVSTVAQTRQALVNDSVLSLASGASARVEALTTARIDTLALSGAGAGAGAAVFSNTSNNIDAKTYARVTGSRGSAGAMHIKARDASAINSLAGGVAAAGNVAVGVASAVNRINNDIQAQLSGNRAGVGFSLADLAVQAESDAAIRTASVSAGFSGTVAVNVGVSTSLLNTATRALIDDGARVVAQNNVIVTALNRDVINSYGGIVAGSGNAAVGGLASVNLIQSSTEAAIRGTTTRVTALAKGAGASVDNGTVSNAPDPDAWADAEQFNPELDLSTGSETVRGLAVRATSLQQVGQVSASAAVALVPLYSGAVSGLNNTSVLGGSTLAAIDQAQINQDNVGADAAQQVSLGAYSHSYTFGGVLNGALSLGAFAGAVTVDSGVMSRDVTARVRGATLTSRGATDVEAASTQAASSIVVSAAGAIVGLAGSGSILVLENNTEALVDRASQLTVGSLSLDASAINSLAPSANTASGGAVAGGAGVAFGYNGSTVRAWLGAQDGSTEGRTRVITAGAVNVEADSVTRILGNSISASGGGAAMAGSVNVFVVENVTEAGAGKLDLGSAGARAASLSIDAYDKLIALSNAGSAAVGGVSLGASANVLVANNATRAMVLDSQIYTAGKADVLARRDTDVQLYTVTGGVGGSAALGGSVGLLLLGSGATAVDGSDPMSELDKDGNGTLSMVNSFTDRDAEATEYQTMVLDADTGEYVLVTRSNAGDIVTVNASGNVGAAGDRLKSGTTYKHETLARVSGGRLDAQGAVKVEAADYLATRNLAGSAQLSGTAAVGAAVAYTLSNSRVNAEVNGLVNAGSLTINALSGALDATKPAVKVETYTGAGGFGVGLGAAVSVAEMNNIVGVSLGGVQTYSGKLDALAQDDLDLSVYANGAAVGAAAVGIVVGTGIRNSGVGVAVADSSRLTATGIELEAKGLGGSSVQSIGAAGGLLGAGTAVVSVALDGTSVQTRVGDNVLLHGRSAGVLVKASALPEVYASAIGATVGGGAGVGASYARAEASTLVNAALGNFVDVQGSGGLTVLAGLENNRSGTEIDPNRATVRAEAVAGSGGIYFSANGTVAEAINASQVYATTGTDLKLPSGRVEINASSRTQQYADALGIAVGGLAVGASVAEAKSTTVTHAKLGDRANDRNRGSLVDDLIVTAIGEDINQAKSVAGSGGLVAGNASVAITRTHGTTHAEIGQAVDVAMLSLALTSKYTALYGTHADSVNAALAGASGAASKNYITTNSKASVGRDAKLYADNDVLLSANSNIFSRHLGEAASGAGGGVISGQAVFNTTTVTSDTLVDIGENAALLAGAGAQNAPGKLIARAFTRHEVDEEITLSTGGLLAGGGVENTHTAALTNHVRVGNNAQLTSFGQLGLGTYTISAASIDALASTWGAAGIAVAKAKSTVVSNQTVEVGDGADLSALSNIELSAGRDPEGLWQTRINSNAVAHSVVRGIIAIPDATAESYIVNSANVMVKANANVLAARNITVGGYNGINHAGADGEARGYQLGFIPVTSRDSRSNVLKDSAATLNGNFLAGRYNELLINIDASGNLTQNAGLPVLWVNEASFNPTQFLNSIPGMDEVTKRILGNTIANSVTGAIALGPMLAAGGNITINADRLAGNATLTANGGPKIEVINRSSKYLLVGDALIPDQPGGRVLFTGGAGAAQFAGATINQVNADRRASIRIDNSYAGSSGNVSYGPAIFLTGDLYNLGGLIHISNAKGSLGQFGSTYGQQVLVEVPEGSMSVFQPNDYWPVGGNPLSEWKNFAGVPGSANYAIQLVANYVYGPGALLVNNSGVLLQGPIYGNASGSSVVLFGACLPASLSAGANCNEGTAKSYTGFAVQFRGISNADSWMPVIPVLSLHKSAANYEMADLSGSAASKRIVGGQVGIQAKYIDINGTISSGLATNRSITVGASLDTWLASHHCATNTCVTAVDIPVEYLSASGGSKLINAKYDFVNQRILVDDVNASGGGFVYMKGGIISTNPLGRIEVNNGYGQVSVNNLSSAQLQLGNIDTGAGSVGIVQIVDTFKSPAYGQPATTWYVHTQGSGLSIFDNRNGGSSISSAYLVSSSGANSATYNPSANLRYQWSQTATLQRQIERTENSISSSDWVWSYPQPNDPWQLNAGSVVQGNAGQGVYEQNISGSLGSEFRQGVNYHGCDDSIGSNCNWDFKASGQYPADHARKGEFYSNWTYRFPEWASITVSHSVKADNPFQIAFIGNATGSINASTTNDLLLGGKLNNPGGTTTLTAGGSILNMPEANIFAKDVALTAGGAIGNAASALQASLAAGGSLLAKSGAMGINIQLGSDALVRQINAGDGTGDVVIRSLGNLFASQNLAATDAHVVGRNIDLTSTSGSVGESGRALRIHAKEVYSANSSSTHGVVNVTANRDIFLHEITGDTWAGKIASETGNVWLKVENGSLYDAGRRLASDTLDDTQREAVWQKLSLTESFGAQANIYRTSVQPFEDQVNASYREFWRLSALGIVSNGVFELDAANLAFLRPLAELRLGETGLTDQQVADYAAGRYAELEGFFTAKVDANWRQRAEFQSFDTAFAYTASAEQVRQLTENAIWTEGELRYAIDKTALGPASGTAVGSADPNLSGRTVTVQVGKSIGQLADSLTIDAAKLRSGDLTAQEAAALAVANAPGDVVLNRNAGGDIVSLTVNRTLPFYVAASDRFDATVGGSMYLQSAGDLKVGSVNVADNARLAAAGSILAASGAPGSFTVGQDITLLAGTGSLGTADAVSNMLTLDVGGRLLAASAGQDVALRWTNGDFRLGQVFAVGDIHLDALAGSMLGQFDGLAISGRNINLFARDDIRSLNGALQVELESASSGRVSAQAGGDVSLTSGKALSVSQVSATGALSIASLAELLVQSATAGGDLTLNADGDMTLGQAQAGGDLFVNGLGAVSLQDSLSASADLTLSAASLVMAHGSTMKAAGTLALSTDGDMVLGQLQYTGDGSTDLFNLRAGGSLTVNGDGQTNLLASAAGRSIIEAGLGIGTSAASLLVNLPELTEIRALAGDIHLTHAQNLSGSLIQAQAGSVSLINDGGELDYGTLDARNSLSFGGGSLTAGRVTAQTGNVLVRATGDADVDNLSSAGWLDAEVRGAASLGQLIVGTQSRLDIGNDLQLGSLTSGGDAQLALGAAGLIDHLDVGGDLMVSVIGALELNEGTVAGDATLRHVGASGTSLHYGELAIGQTLTVSGAGDWTGDSARVAGDISFDVGNAELGLLESTAGELTLTVDGRLTGQTLRTGRGNIAVTADTASLANVDAASSMKLQTGGDMTIINGRSGSSMVISAGGSAALDHLVAGGHAQFDIDGDLRLTSLVGAANAELHLGSAAQITTLDLGGDLALSVAGPLDLDLARVSGRASLTHTGSAGTALSYRQLNIGESLAVSGAGDWSGALAQVSGDARFDVGSARLGLLESTTGVLSLEAAGSFAADELHSRQQWVQLVARSADLGNVSAATTLDAHTAGNLTILTGRSGANMALTTEAGSLGTIRFGQLADANAAGVLDVAHLQAGADMLVQTDGDVFGGNAEAAGELRMIGRNLFFGRAQSLGTDVYLQATGAAPEGNGNITGLLVDAKRDVAILANGNLNMPTVRFGGTYSLKAGRDLVVGVGQDLNVGGTAEAGRDLTFVIGGSVDLEGVTAGRHVSIRSGEYINIHDSVTAGGNISLNANGGDITVGNGITSTAQPYLGQALRGDVLLNATGNISSGLVRAADGKVVADGNNLSFGSINSAETVDLLALGAIRVGNSVSQGDQQWTAGAGIGFDSLLTQGQALLDSLLDTRGGSIQAARGIVANAGWRNGVATPASLVLQQTVAPTLSLFSGNLIKVMDAQVGESADLHAQHIELVGKHTGAGQLDLTVTGLNNNGLAGETFRAGLDARKIVVSLLDTAFTEFDTTASQVDFVDARNVDVLLLTTPQAVVSVDNVSPAHRLTADVQVHEMDKKFWLKQNGIESYTDGYVLHRNATHLVRVPNFAEGHVDGGVDYQAITSADHADILLSRQNVRLRLGHLMNRTAGYVTPKATIKDQDPAVAPLNTDWQAFQQAAQGEQQTWGI
ncbi:leukotoxin LktA family filamentous adhesin [Halopseudomonas nanhaiensis]|uniref:leukotoxin LktA family filamentous adhesin n=1 Tax=Halopseudomonas nanhaiensis TaxID=2830842 RepID=UPI001CC0F922|nr:leukotoxin LktA family filamentous adhesin [Halopseudomonas nanhaiensis]UAW97349.1 leukotoxin LktA family filamentous adhesin [Halopseudomonas nanhaiensis]